MPRVTTQPKKTGDHDESMSTLKKEESTCIRLPSFVDRLALMGKQPDSATSTSGSCSDVTSSCRWFPYAYEVVIMQWCAILIAQRRLTENASNASTTTSNKGATNPSSPDDDSDDVVDVGTEAINQAAIRSIGVAVASAPFLFEIIKQSLGYRILNLFRAATNESQKNNHSNINKHACPPLVKLDETLLLNLEQAISMVTDACLDSRNFDSWELRRMSIDVNDSIIRFLRDMFSFLAPECVHRLILIYTSRFVTKEGKQWQDRDSGIGLRCSWEITKLRVNAGKLFGS